MGEVTAFLRVGHGNQQKGDYQIVVRNFRSNRARLERHHSGISLWHAPDNPVVNHNGSSNRSTYFRLCCTSRGELFG